MKDKFKKVFSKYNSLSQESKSTYFYGTIFVLILVTGLVLKLTGNLDTTKNNQIDNSSKQEENQSAFNYEEIFSKIGDNYEEDIIINTFFNKEYINIKKDSNKEYVNYINLKNKELNSVYFKISNSIYQKKEEENYELINEEILNSIELTFVRPENILELLNNSTYKKDNKYMIETSEWLKLYNKINNASVSKLVTGEIEINIDSFENNELKITMDLTNLYKNLNYDYEKVICNINLYNINNVDLSNVISE